MILTSFMETSLLREPRNSNQYFLQVGVWPRFSRLIAVRGLRLKNCLRALVQQLLSF
jgi:hypothetical protein